MKKFFKGITATLVISTMLLTSCDGKVRNTLDDEIVVYTSFSAMSAIAKPLVTNNTVLLQLTDGSVEPHDFEPTTKNIMDISETDMFIYNGVGFEHYINKLEASVEGNVVFVNSAKNINYRVNDNQGVDAHVWLNIDNAIVQATNISRSLIEIDGKNEKVYSDNLKDFINKAMALEDEYDYVLSKVEIEAVVVLHPAYGYIFEPYGIKQIAIQQDHDVEPTISELKEVIDYINDNEIKYVFAQNNEDSKPLYTVLSETNAEVLNIYSMENIALEDINRDTYFKVMGENLKAIELLLN